jgi:hypothetical protein
MTFLFVLEYCDCILHEDGHNCINTYILVAVRFIDFRRKVLCTILVILVGCA